MIPSNMHPEASARGLRRTFLQAASDFLTARARRRTADRARARPRLEGLEDRCLMSITEYPIPTGGASAWGITTGPDGNLWFAEFGASKVGVINPTTHAISDFATPTASSSPRGITAGSDGNLWFTEDVGKIGMINPTTHAITEFATPTAGSHTSWVTAGPDGNLWFTEADNASKLPDQIGMINPTTHVITEFPVPTANSNLRGICAGPDGNIWFTEAGANKIGMINPTTHAIAEFPVPTAGSFPRAIVSGPDGNLWFAEGQANQVGMINPTTHTISEFAGTAGGTLQIAAGPDGNVWFTEGGAGKIGMINPTTHTINEFTIPYASSFTEGITTGPDGNIWFTDFYGANAIGVITLNSNADHFVVTQQPPSSITAGSPFGATVQADDRSGNLDTSFNGTVTVALASNPGGDTLGGTVSVTASGGVATFSGLTLTRAASGYTLQASAGGVDGVTTSAITVTAATATQVVITQQPPATVKVSSPFALKASIEDAYGNVVTTSTGTVSVAFANNPTGATLGGTTSVTVSQGVASFTNLTINKTGSGYTLQVTSTGLTSATSSPIKVSQNGKAPVRLLPSAGNASPDLSLAPLVLDSPELWLDVPLKKRPRSS
jgi:streptogramin lyase